MNVQTIYLDNAATSWPKPPGVAAAMTECLNTAGGNPGRSGHRLSLAAGRVMYEVREALAELLGAPDPLRIIFTHNATAALNLALAGLLRTGQRVVCTSMEHNAVMRPLRALAQSGVQLEVVACASEGTLDPAAMARAVTPGTRLVVVNHASNVTGTLAPVAAVAEVVRRAGALLLVDATQTAGAYPIDMGALGIDILAFTGHKGLLGPPGTGGLILGERVDPAELAPLMRGGTGSRSEEEVQPEDLPDKYESGTPNFAGIAGLGVGLAFVRARGVAALRAHEMEMANVLREGLQAISGVTVYEPSDPEQRVAVVSFTAAGLPVSEIGFQLDEEFGVLSRVGLHCAPAAHRTIGTFPGGTVRLAPGVFTTADEVRAAAAAIADIVRRAR